MLGISSLLYNSCGNPLTQTGEECPKFGNREAARADGRRVLEVDVAHAVGEPGKNDQRLVGIYKRLNPGPSINRNCLLAQYNGSKKNSKKSCPSPANVLGGWVR